MSSFFVESQSVGRSTRIAPTHVGLVCLSWRIPRDGRDNHNTFPETSSISSYLSTQIRTARSYQRHSFDHPPAQNTFSAAFFYFYTKGGNWFRNPPPIPRRAAFFLTAQSQLLFIYNAQRVNDLPRGHLRYKDGANASIDESKVYRPGSCCALTTYKGREG